MNLWIRPEEGGGVSTVSKISFQGKARVQEQVIRSPLLEAPAGNGLLHRQSQRQILAPRPQAGLRSWRHIQAQVVFKPSFTTSSFIYVLIRNIIWFCRLFDYIENTNIKELLIEFANMTTDYIIVTSHSQNPSKPRTAKTQLSCKDVVCSRRLAAGPNS